MKNILAILIFVFTFGATQAQVGYGLTTQVDIYQNYKNPKSFDGGSSGNVLFNLGVGPKIWFGNNNVSLSLEAPVVVGLTSFSLKEYRGLGSLAIPMMAKVNFKGLSTFDNEGMFGFSIGGGMQLTKTELYYRTQAFRDGNGKRDFFWIPVAQVGYGFGVNGFTLTGFLRVGHDFDSKATTFNIGIQNDFNIPKLRTIAKPESAL